MTLEDSISGRIAVEMVLRDKNMVRDRISENQRSDKSNALSEMMETEDCRDTAVRSY